MQKHDRIFFGRFEDGKLKIKDKARLDLLASLMDKKEVKLEVSEYRKTRSSKQNSYYWAVVIPMIGEHTGCERWEYEHLHYEIMRELLGTVKKGNLQIVKSSKRMDTLEFTDYIETVRRWAAQELGINIPDPI